MSDLEVAVNDTPVERRTALCVLPYFHVYGNIVVMDWAIFSCAVSSPAEIVAIGLR